MRRLAKIIGNEIVFARYGDRVEIDGRVLFSPTEATYRAMGFSEVPTANPPEGWHDEYSIETRTETRVVHPAGSVKALRKCVRGGDGKARFVTEFVDVSEDETEEVTFPVIVATAVEDAPLPPAPEIPVIYSKLKLVSALDASGNWEAVKAKLEQFGLYDKFIAAQELSSDYPGFGAIVAQFKAAFPGVDVDAILEEARA